VRVIGLLLSIYCVAACGGSDDAVRHPGPCTAAGERTECTFTYDDADRLIGTECVEHAPGGDAPTTMTWTYANDALAGFTLDWYDDSFHGDETWTIAADEVTRIAHHGDGIYEYADTETYDPATFALTGIPFDPRLVPTADDALLTQHHVFTMTKSGEQTVDDYTFTYAPAEIPATGERVRTRNDGDSGVFEYEDGRPTDQPARAFQWDGDRLVERSEFDGRGYVYTYTYDAAGNLVQRGSSNDVIEYEYGCWQ
jgi:YD repeat-containing protein